MSTEIPRLTEAEEIVMLAIWDLKNDVEHKKVVEQVNGAYDKKWAPQTISTFMSNLRRKHYIELVRNGRKCSYRIQVDENEYRRQVLKDMCILLYNDDKELIRRDLELV